MCGGRSSPSTGRTHRPIEPRQRLAAKTTQLAADGNPHPRAIVEVYADRADKAPGTIDPTRIGLYSNDDAPIGGEDARRGAWRYARRKSRSSMRMRTTTSVRRCS